MDKLELHDCWGSSFAELLTKGELALPSLANNKIIGPRKLQQNSPKKNLCFIGSFSAKTKFVESLLFFQKGLEVCYCLWGCDPDPRLGPILGQSRSHPGSEGVPSRFAMCFVLQHFGPIQVPRWGPSPPVLVPPSSRAFLPDRAWTEAETDFLATSDFFGGPQQNSGQFGPQISKIGAQICHPKRTMLPPNCPKQRTNQPKYPPNCPQMGGRPAKLPPNDPKLPPPNREKRPNYSPNHPL